MVATINVPEQILSELCLLTAHNNMFAVNTGRLSLACKRNVRAGSAEADSRCSEEAENDRAGDQHHIQADQGAQVCTAAETGSNRPHA